MDCPFCDPPTDRVFYEDELVLGLWDAYPVSDGHALVVTRRHEATWLDASAGDRAAVMPIDEITQQGLGKTPETSGSTSGFHGL